MTLRVLAFLALLALIYCSPQVSVSVGQVIANTLPEFASFTLDWWPKDGGCKPNGWGTAGILTLDLKSQKLKNLAKAFSPGFLRIGGSLDKKITYLVNENVTCPDPKYCLNMTRWVEVLDFVKETNLKLIFGLSYPVIGETAWDYTNPEAFLKYTAKQGYTMYGIELGEEMEPSLGTEHFTNYVAAYKKCKEIIEVTWAGRVSQPRLMGPCPGMSQFTHLSWMDTFINATLGYLDDLVYHSYDEKPAPGFIEQTLTQGKSMKAIADKHKPPIPVWLGEGGPHNGGGLPNISNTFSDGFYYLDALGQLSNLGHAAFNRQSFVGCHYELVDTNTFEPNPDYYTGLLWKKFMGPRVLGLKLVPSDDFHIYAHCGLVAPGSVAFAVLNNNPSESVEVTIEGLVGTETRNDYFFSSKELLSRDMYLNGNLLKMNGDNLPTITPLVSAGSSFTVKPQSYGYVVFPNAKYDLCASQ